MEDKRADRIEWLHHAPHRDDRATVISQSGTEDAYWAEVEKTFHWTGFVLSRRLTDLGRALARGVLGSRSPWN